MTGAEARRRFAAAPVARLSTVTPAGAPHIVPIVFACERDVVYTGVDRKPKSGRPLQRLRNIEGGSAASVLVDHYTERWEDLWWVRADGTPVVLGDGSERDRAIEMLVDRYERYRTEPPDDIIIRIGVHTWRWWSWT